MPEPELPKRLPKKPKQQRKQKRETEFGDRQREEDEYGQGGHFQEEIIETYLPDEYIENDNMELVNLQAGISDMDHMDHMDPMDNF